MNLTATQREAIAARGNVLVVAGAGTGKTRTLVERCLDCLVNERPRVSLEEILLVTFTEAAALEMRQRIRARLEQEQALHPSDLHWQEQLALFETAHLGTLHSFCLKLIRQHFYELELDPQVTVLPEEEARLLAEETLDQLLEKYYAGRSPGAEAVQRLIQVHAKGSDQPIRELVLRIHHYSQTLPKPCAWLQAQQELFSQSQPELWREWLLEALEAWRREGLTLLNQAGAANDVAAECRQHLLALPSRPSPTEASSALALILEAEQNCPRGSKKLWLKPLAGFLEDSRFLQCLLPTPDAPDPLQEDWEWVRGHMAALLGFVKGFGEAFAETKRELGMVDFHDLEQHALTLLAETGTGRPSEVAQHWRKQLRFVFVDEYQDINAAQDKIIEALSRGGAEENKFLVGDVKQSIYRFRLANPGIFQAYLRSWGSGAGRVIPLVENFRSRRGILDFVNSVMGRLMHQELGGIEYDEQARLRFGERAESRPEEPQRRAVELLLRIKGTFDEEQPEEEVAEGGGVLGDLQEAAKEARLLARRLHEVRNAAEPVWDEAENSFRPVQWRDMAILLRSPATKAESYAKEFARAGIPLQIARSGFYDSLEVEDLLNLLQVLDNPLQDVPLLAVLRGPLVGLALDELVEIRLALRGSHFWGALVRWHQVNGPNSVAGSWSEKVGGFLAQFARWRRLARQVSLSRCLEIVLAETRYAEWLLTEPRGEQRYENVKRLLLLTQRFDQLQRQGLYRFLRFIAAQQAAQSEPDTTVVALEDAVRLLSIHQSKGLEFPVVVLADLGKPFNLQDLRSEIILDEQFGICPRVRPPRAGKHYPSLPHWLAARRQHREVLGEELRLLYVAMTRARDLLLLSGTVSKTNFEKFWQNGDTATAGTLHKARGFADWLAGWFSANVSPSGAFAGEHELFRWGIQDDRALVAPEPSVRSAPDESERALELEPGAREELAQRFAWRYSYDASTRLPAKTSVSAVRRQALLGGDEVAAVGSWGERAAQPGSPVKPPNQPGPIEVGNAHHAFLQAVSLELAGGEEQLLLEADRLKHSGALSQAEIDLLDFKALSRFWGSAIGRDIREQADSVKRELPFTFRLPAREVAEIIGEADGAIAPDDFVVVQGVADLAVVLEKEIWLLDFKTDKAGSHEDLASRRYEPQLKLYARALSEIYQRPVTKAWLHFLSTGRTIAVSTEP
jgi:ATP-dependent helicase/nuclease subunit A